MVVFFLTKILFFAIWHNKSVDRSFLLCFEKLRYVVLPEPREWKSQIWQQPPVLYSIASRYKPGFFIVKKRHYESGITEFDSFCTTPKTYYKYPAILKL